MGKLSSFIGSMIKVGVVGFGGGNALIPVLEQEVVKEKKLVTKEEFDKDIIAATLTPGALPVEMASGVGLQACGRKGMVLGGTLMALPGAILTVLLMSVLGQANDTILEQIQYASIGITAFIMCLLTEYIWGTLKTYKNSRFRVLLWAIIIGVFVLTGEKSFYGILQIDQTPVFGISTIDVLLLSFFAILYTGCKFNWINVGISVIIGAVYLLSVGKSGIIESDLVTWIIRGVMLVLAVYGVAKGDGKKKKKKEKNQTKMGVLADRMGIWVLFVILCSIPAIVYLSDKTGAIMYQLRGLLSSLLSFGGGDAYLTIADGLFVGDYISETDFYSTLVLMVNVLPGSILCKTLSGIGYAYGYTLGGMTGGYLLAIAGFSMSVAASCGVFYFIFHIYELLERIEVFVKIKKSIRVIVSGLLLTVMAGLIKSGITVNSNSVYPWFTVLVMILGIYILDMVLMKKAKCKNLTMIIVSLVLSLGICNIMGI